MNSTVTININSEIYENAKSISDSLGYAYVGDFLENLLYKETLELKSYNNLSEKIQAGIDSGFVDVDENFWKKIEKKLGVEKSSYAN